MSDPIERVHFTSGQLLSVDDLRTEQDYHRRMRWLHNRMLHGTGVVSGVRHLRRLRRLHRRGIAGVCGRSTRTRADVGPGGPTD